MYRDPRHKDIESSEIEYIVRLTRRHFIGISLSDEPERNSRINVSITYRTNIIQEEGEEFEETKDK